MTKFEDTVSRMLHDLVPEPPHELDAQTITNESGRSRTSVMHAALAAAVLVIVLAIGIAVLSGQHRRSRTSTTTGSDASVKLSGELFAVGGPPNAYNHQRPPRPLRGMVTITDTRSGRVIRTVTVRSDGTFSVSLPPGRYSVEGRSPQYNAGNVGCSANAPITLTAGARATANVYCQEK
jgi:hypothetical protein